MKQAGAAVTALAALAALPSLANGFVYDDVPAIVENPLVHGLAHSSEIWHSSYWTVGTLFRPVTLQLFALEWAAGGGRPAIFHAVSIGLTALVAFLVYRLARRLLPPVGAVAAAALFAVHPVHVEVVANVVGQAELLAALFGVIAVERYLAWRAEEGLTTSRRWALAGLTLLAILAKETGYIVPMLLAAAELTLVSRERRAGAALRRSVAPAFVLQAVVVAGALLFRAIVLGSLAGETPVAAFDGLAFPDRAVAMLAVVPIWARLLLWPAHLQAEYGPPALPLTSQLGLPHLAGLLVLAAAIAAFAWAWRREPVIGFALAWIAVALIPVSNVATATGVIVSERNLFLPSLGLAIAAGAGVSALTGRLAAAALGLRAGALILCLATLALLAARSIARESAWRSQQEFFPRLVADAPRVYRAHFVASRYYEGVRRYPEAEEEARAALALYGRDPRVYEQLGQVLRNQGRCAEALPVLAEGVRIAPSRTTVRSRLIECALAAGDTALALGKAEEAVRLGQPEFRSTVERLSGAAKTPPRSR